MGGTCKTLSLPPRTSWGIDFAQSLADGVSALCHEQNYEYLRMEGYNTGQWILVDCNDIVVNIFQQSVRDLYQLENLWGAAAAALNKEPRA